MSPGCREKTARASPRTTAKRSSCFSAIKRANLRIELEARMRCPKCNNEYSEGVTRCPHDGELLTDNTAFTPSANATARLDDADVEQKEVELGLTLANRFVLEKKIGAGAMGTVYEARDTKLRRPV